MRNFRKLLIPVAFSAATLLPGAVFAQQEQTNPTSTGVCGTQEAAPILTEGELAVEQPVNLGRTDVGTIDFSAVHGSIVHMEGDLVLLHLETLGQGNAAPNKDLAGDDWAVVRMPAGCSSSFGMGNSIFAVGKPENGILNAVEVTPAS